MTLKQIHKNWQEVELGEILDYEQPTNYIVEDINYNYEYKTPVLTAGKSFILGYTNEIEGIYNKLPVIIFDDFTTDIKFVDFKFKVKSSAMKLLGSKTKEINLKFVYYMMKMIKVDSSTHKRYYLSKYRHLKIPLPFKDGKPDLKTQKQIVEILEKSEAIKAKSKKVEELFGEYLKSVFTEMFFEGEFEVVEIGQVAPLQGGFAFKSKDYSNQGIVLVKITNVWNDILKWEDETFVPNEFLEKYSDFKLEENDLVLSMTRPIIMSLDSVKIAQITKNDPPCLLNQRVGRFQIDNRQINGKYLLHYCYTYRFKKYIEKYCSTSLQPNVSSRQINSIKIPLPPLELQEKFASIVEHIEKLKEKQKRELENAEELFDSLMQKTFRGELVR